MRVRRLARESFHDFLEDRCTVMAAALSYYSLFAMPGLLLVAVYVAESMYGNHAAAGRVQTQFARLLGAKTGSAIKSMIAGATTGTRIGTAASVAAFGGLTFSALAAVYELQIALNQAWDVEVEHLGSRRFILKRIMSLVVMAGAVVLLLCSLLAVPAVSVLTRGLSGTAKDLLYIAEIVIFWAILTALLAVIMKVLPDAEIGWRDVWFGAAVTAALILFGRVVMGTYLASFGFNNAYGVAGSIAALLLWAYYSAAILLLGVEFTRVWAREHGRRIQPEEGAVRVAITQRRILAPQDSRG
ncbi:MAG: YihY/virulence factor BrkB family protein [Deltaproteobacteria bacterium]|nr:YihY/virulence factor BrkB family protein [Deltaproteobacteria bacterium]